MGLLIDKQDAIKALEETMKGLCLPRDDWKAIVGALEDLPEILPEEEFEWCRGCKEYDQEDHCCHRWTKVIRDTVEELKKERGGTKVTCFLDDCFFCDGENICQRGDITLDEEHSCCGGCDDGWSLPDEGDEDDA